MVYRIDGVCPFCFSGWFGDIPQAKATGCSLQMLYSSPSFRTFLLTSSSWSVSSWAAQQTPLVTGQKPVWNLGLSGSSVKEVCVSLNSLQTTVTFSPRCTGHPFESSRIFLWFFNDTGLAVSLTGTSPQGTTFSFHQPCGLCLSHPHNHPLRTQAQVPAGCSLPVPSIGDGHLDVLCRVGWCKRAATGMFLLASDLGPGFLPPTLNK